MSQHPSLKISLGSLQQKSVLKRYERIRVLKEKNLWETVPSIFHLPKVKTVKIRVKKVKAAEAPEAAAAAGAAGSAPAAAPSAKTPTGAPKQAAPSPAKGTLSSTKPTPPKKEESKK